MDNKEVNMLLSYSLVAAVTANQNYFEELQKFETESINGKNSFDNRPVHVLEFVRK